jgi:DNA-binding PadR family transcriptional regulator
MDSEVPYRATERYFSRIRKYKPAVTQEAVMGKQERKQLVLKFLSDAGLALPPKVLFRNLRLRENATFSEKSLNNYLTELEADGLVKRVDPAALTDRNISAVGADERGYYLITESGLNAVTDHAPDDRPA